MGEVIHFSAAVLEQSKRSADISKPALSHLQQKLNQLKAEYETPHFRGHDNQSTLKRVQHLVLLGQLESALLGVERIKIELASPEDLAYSKSPINRIRRIEKIFAEEGFGSNQIGAEILSALQVLKPKALILPLEAELADLTRRNHINDRIIAEICDMVAELEQSDLVDIPYDRIKEVMAQAAKVQLDKAILELQESPFLAKRDFAIQEVATAQKCGVNTTQAENLIEQIFPQSDYDREKSIPEIKDRVEAARSRIRK